MDAPQLSIILPTCNRAALLRRALEVLGQTTHCDYEVVAVDGASDDDTPEVLAQAGRVMGPRLRVIREERRQGVVKAMNVGCRAARGKYLAFMNDDARPLPGSYDNALAQISHAPPGVGLLAFFHRINTTRNIAYETYHLGVPFRVMHVRATLYANFPMGSRALFERLDYFDERFVVSGSDPDFSLKVWHAGLSVQPAFGALLDHDEHQDQRRADDTAQRERDTQLLFSKWDLPERNPHVNDFDPTRPCTLRGCREGP